MPLVWPAWPLYVKNNIVVASVETLWHTEKEKTQENNNHAQTLPIYGSMPRYQVWGYLFLADYFLKTFDFLGCFFVQLIQLFLLLAMNW